jgi:RND family efflux transporter MFP subunit
MTRRTKWGLAALGVVLAVGVGAAVVNGLARSQARSAEKKEQPPLEFAARDLATLAPRIRVQELVLPGTVQAVSQAVVRSKLSAEVRRVAVREGDRVQAGQVVAEFDTAQLKMQLAERAAALESARAQLAQIERTRAANAHLVKQNFISQNAFDTADSAYRAQLAAVEAAQAQLAQTQLLLADAVVRAPIAGSVAKRFVQPGEKVAFDAPLLSIVDLTRLEVQAQAPVADVALITAGAPAEVEIEGLPERRFGGRVERINPAAEPGSRAIHVYVGLANEQRLLRAGMFARVHLRVGKDQQVPALPIAAVQNEGGQNVVWVIADGRLAKRAVVVGRRDERARWVEIVDGLTPADRVLATRFDNLREGLAAKVVADTAAATKGGEKGAPPASVPAVH